MVADHTILAVHSNPREISHMLIGSGQLIEESSLAAVLVSGQGKGQGLSLRNALPDLVRPVILGLPDLSHTRVGDGRVSFFLPGLPVSLDLDFLRVGQAQRQLIPPQFQLYGVAHGRDLAQGYLRARRQPHIQQMVAEFSLASHHLNNSVLPYL